jgi:hypothetical protein
VSQPPHHLLHYIGFCPICSTGPLALRTCGRCQQVCVMCDECDAVWPDWRVDEPRHRGDDDLECPRCRASLLAADAHWSLGPELEACQWLKEAIAGGLLALRTGQAFVAEANNCEENPPQGENLTDNSASDDELLPGC